MRRARNSKVLVVATGAYGNLGDTVIRRRALEWARPLGEVHIYLGNAPSGWVEQLGVSEREVRYGARERAKWILRALFDPSVTALMLDPGEVGLSKSELATEIIFALVTLALVVRGAKVVRPPRSLGASTRSTLLVHRLACKASTLTLWRNEESLNRVGVGLLAPDTAFSDPRRDGTPWDQRRLLLISMRGRRQFPSAAWQASVTAIAAEFGLSIRLVIQVREDATRSEEIADALGAELDVWEDVTDLEHERHLRELYEDAAIVVSDRLHVLILSAVAGAVPLEIADGPVPKIESTFGLIGAEPLSLDSRSCTSDEAVKFARRAVADREVLATQISNASAQLAQHLAQIYFPNRIG